MSDNNLAHILRALIPDWSGLPVYPVHESEGPPEPLLRTGIAGIYSPGLHIALFPWLTKLERWRGPGPAFLVRDTLIRAMINDRCPDDSELAAKVSDGWIRAVALHEAAHAIIRPISTVEPTPEKVVELFCFVNTSNRQAEAQREATPGPPMEVPGFLYHDWRFIRAALHLHDRHIRDVGPLPLVNVIRARTYNLSSEYAYRHALATELKSMPSAPFADILQTPPPDEFIQLFQADVARWLRHNEETET